MLHTEPTCIEVLVVLLYRLRPSTIPSIESYTTHPFASRAVNPAFLLNQECCNTRFHRFGIVP